MDLTFFLELAVNGALAGLMYSLVAIGIVLIYKSSSVPNLAQGALAMLGAYIVLAFSTRRRRADLARDPAAIVTMFCVGIGIERVALRRSPGRPIVMILMMTLGLDIFLRATSMAIWGGSGAADEGRHQRRAAVSRPAAAEPRLRRRRRSSRCCIFARLHALLSHAPRHRAARRSPTTTPPSWSVGISVERGVALSWAMSSVVATAAGVLWGSVQGVDQSLALLLLKGVTVAVLGGLDSIGGAVLAGCCSASLEDVASAYLDPLLGGGSRDLVVAAILILTIMIGRTACSAATTSRGSDMLFRQAGSSTPITRAERALFPIAGRPLADGALLVLGARRRRSSSAH